MDNNVNNTKKKNNTMVLVIAAVIVLLLLGLALWFFVLKGNDKKENNTNNTENGTVETDPKTGEYDYTKGVLHTVDGESSFVIKGVMLVGDERNELGYMDKFAEGGFKTKDLKTTFKKGEWINLYLDTEYQTESSEARIYITQSKLHLKNRWSLLCVLMFHLLADEVEELP